MTRNLKPTKVIIIGNNANQGCVSDAILNSLEKECGITIEFPKPLIQRTNYERF